MKMDRILLKLSGEALAGDKKTGFDEATVAEVARQVKKICDTGIQVSIVIGGGNFWRGRTSDNMDRVKADQIPPAYPVENEKLILVCIDDGASKPKKALVDFCRNLDNARCQNVAFSATTKGGVEAAKELILQTEIPHIVNRGRKGGSNVAAAICNAILYELGR